MSQTESRTCPSCNAVVEPDDGFCASCGRRLRSCSSGGEPLRPGAAFCPKCGTPSGDEAPPAAAATPAATLVASPAAASPVPATAATGPVPSPPPATEAPGTARPANTIALVAGIAIAVTALLPWLTAQAGGADANAFDVPITALYDENAGEAAFKIGHLVAALGAVIAVASFRPSTRALRRALGIATALTAVAFAVYLTRILEGSGASFTDFFGFGAWMALAAGAFVAVRA